MQKIQNSWKTHLNQINFKLSFKISLAALTSLYVCHELDRYIKHPDIFTSGLWCVIASIFASLPTLGGTYKAIWNRFLGVLVGSAIGAFFASQWGAHPFVLGMAVFTTAIISFLCGLKESYRMACLSVAVIIVPWGMHPTLSPWAYAFYRFLDTCIGLGVAVFIAKAVWPSQAFTVMQKQMSDVLNQIRQAYEYIVVSANHLNKSDAISKSLLNDVEQAFNQIHVNLEESKIELFVGFSPATLWVDLLGALERLWENVKDLKKVFNSVLEEIFDEELKREVCHLNEQIDFILKDLSENLKTGDTQYNYSQIPLLQEALNNQLVRFRETKNTKKYSLDRVETYFVFFYNLKSILNELQQLQMIIHQDVNKGNHN
ncbi:FUSC family protein [Candidatus Protochlamydia sp. W-9]|uniref:FUSC family protein n=1 Tax=Candidatus Protochlamydia sp. W-9 TaxID=1785087 RepID=UPI00096A3ED5|nr:FUSC family protein [Candidatus Protochlamydia sp. W-9]